MKRLLLLTGFMAAMAVAAAQTVSGTVSAGGKPLEGVEIFRGEFSYLTDRKGEFRIVDLKPGEHVLQFYKYGFRTLHIPLAINDRDTVLVLDMIPLEEEIEEVVVQGGGERTYGMATLKAVEGVAIYASKKNEVIVLNDLVANKAAGNPRQIFARVAGANIWESDCAGLQIGVASRGLSPNRNSNFNTRQNGYDISADPLGYPESYYTPALQAVERIEVVRGASSLQYGTQFGGMVNFVLAGPPEDKVVEFRAEENYNSLGFFNGYHALAGTYRKISYQASNRFTKGNCWRCNSDFTSNNNFVRLAYRPSERVSIGVEYTYMRYLAHQPGGLTDAQFSEDPMQSNRERNWFAVNWNLPAIILDLKPTDRMRINWRNYALIGGRDALGNLQAINRADGGGPRDFLQDDFYNFGSELRLLQRYEIAGRPSSFLVGTRVFRGLTDRSQGLGSDGDDADFSYAGTDPISAYRFPNINWAVFVENVFSLGESWTVTPGARFEYIRTLAEGYYRTIVTDGAGNVLQDTRTDEAKTNTRVIALGGVGVSYRPHAGLEVYGNISQNYRAINFNDIRVINPNAAVDENLKDEKGFNADLGIRGQWAGWRFDVTAFALRYKDKIGDVFTTVPDPVLIERAVRLRTNVSDARNLGIELFVEKNLLDWSAAHREETRLVWFANYSYIHSVYVRSGNTAFDGNRVELVPPHVFRTGLSFDHKGFSTALQFSYVNGHYTDATNAEFTPNAVDGRIPSYAVLDWSAAYAWKWLSAEAGINNLANNKYFTRRASGYPGPGIIPSDGISVYVGVGFRISRPRNP